MNENQPKTQWIPKGWGGEKIIVNCEKYCGKILYFVKGKKCSFHFHKLKTETFFLNVGKVILYYSDESEEKIKESIERINTKNYLHYMAKIASRPNLIKRIVLNKGDSFHIPLNRVHQIVALEDTEIIEFSTTHYDSDSYRIIKGD